MTPTTAPTRTTPRAHTLLKLAGVAAGVALLGACASTPDPVRDATVQRAYQAPRPYDAGNRLVSESLGPSSPAPSRQGPELIAQTTIDTSRDRKGNPTINTPLPGEVVNVQYSANDANIIDVARILVDEYLDADFVIDPELKSNSGVTLVIDEEMTLDEVRNLVAHIVALAGGHLEERDGVLFARASLDSKNESNRGRNASAPILTSAQAIGSPMPALRVAVLDNLQANTLQQLFKALLSPGGVIIAQGRTALIVDTQDNAQRIAALIELMDQPEFAGTQVATYRLANRDPDSVAKMLDQIKAGAAIQSGLAFVPLPGTQRLMVLAKDQSLQTFGRDLIEQVDVPMGTEARYRYLYRVQHWDTPALITFVAASYPDRAISTGAAAASATVRPAGAPGAGLPPISITGDEAEDVLLITATPDDYADILKTLRAVDRPRQQVHLSGIIAEVNLNESLEYGVESFINLLDEDGIGILDFISVPPAAGSGADAGSLSFIGGDGFALLRAIETKADVNVLSTPKITIRDRDEAEFQVGGETPFPSVNTTGDNEGDITRQSIERKPTGIVLKVTPYVNESGSVRLEIDQEITDVGAQTEFGPEFTTRKLKTTVIVPHGQTVILAGIIDSTSRDSTNQVPGLGDVPVAGAAFRSEAKSGARTELFLAITPTIVNEPVQLAGPTSDFLIAADAIRRLLHESADEIDRGVLAMRPADEPLIIRADQDPAPPRPETPSGDAPAPPQPVEPDPAPPAQPDAAPPKRTGPPDMPPMLRELLRSSGQEG